MNNIRQLSSFATPLAEGNRAMRAREYEYALDCYLAALIDRPLGLQKTIVENIYRTARAMQAKGAGADKTGIVCWDLGRNALGRAYVLQNLHAKKSTAEIIGPMLEKIGEPSAVWGPLNEILSEQHLCQRTWTWSCNHAEDFIADALMVVSKNPYDTIHLSKPRGPSLVIGLLYKWLWNSLVLLDIDDEELGFVDAYSPLEIEVYLKECSLFPPFGQLAGREWTCLAVGCADLWDAITVSNPALEQRYGGVVIRHARDSAPFLAARQLNSRTDKRNAWGVTDDDKVVLFLGTPRAHKGLLDIAHAILALGRHEIVFAVSDAFEDGNQKHELQRLLGDKLKLFPPPSFGVMPEWVCAADLCVLWQDPDSLAARFQIPAKLSDALAGGLHVLITEVDACREFKQSSGVEVVPHVLLATHIDAAITRCCALTGPDPEALALFDSEFSIDANMPRLQVALRNAKENARTLFANERLKLLWRNMMPAPFADIQILAPPRVTKPEECWDFLGSASDRQMSNDNNVVSAVAPVLCSRTSLDSSCLVWPYACSESKLLERVRAYRQQKSNRRAKVVVYGAVMGAYDAIVLPEAIVDEWDYVIFFDRPLPEEQGESIYEFRCSPYIEKDPVRSARRLKALSHKLFPEYEIAIWLDPNILVRGEHLKQSVAHMQRENIPLMLNPHPDRHCVYDELKACIARNKDLPEIMQCQIERYRNQGFPANFGMFETGITLRNNKDPRVAQFNEMWWREIEQGSRRDQLSITWVLWSLNIPWALLPNMKNIRHHEGNPYCLFGHASKKDKSTILYRQPTFMRRSSVDLLRANPLPAHSVDCALQIDDSELEDRIHAWRVASCGIAKIAVVYTAIIGNRDVLKIPECLNPEWDYVCFSDRADYPGNHPWQIRRFDYIDADHDRTVNYIKINPHVYFKDYEYSMWIDADLVIKTDYFYQFFNDFRGEGKALAAVVNSSVSSIYIEAAILSQLNKDDAAVIDAQVMDYRSEMVPDNMALIESAILFRRHDDPTMKIMARTWWRELSRGSKFEKLSLNYAVYKHTIDWKSLFKGNQTAYNHPSVRHFPRSMARYDSSYTVPNFLPVQFSRGTQPFWMRPLPHFDQSDLREYTPIPVDIVVCVHNALEDVQVCLQSVVDCLQPAHHVYVIDDCSQMEVADWLVQFVSNKVQLTLIRHELVRGYTRSASEGMVVGNAPFVILLNSDTIVSPNWVLKMLQVALSAQDVGVVGPMSNAASWQSLPLLSDPRTGRSVVNELPADMSPAGMDKLCEQYGFVRNFLRVPLVNGFCYGIKRELIDTIGLFDHIAFPKGYGEEDDFSLRALDAGFMHALATHCYVYHSKSKSFGSDARSVLAAAGSKVLRGRHGDRRIANAVQTMASNPVLLHLRNAISRHCKVHNPKLPVCTLPAPSVHSVRISKKIPQDVEICFYIRDDDFTQITKRFERLEAIAKVHAPILLAVIPNNLKVNKDEGERILKNFIVAQHGYRHISYTGDIEKNEFPPSRARHLVANDLIAGKDIMQKCFGTDMVGNFVAPFNRYAPQYYDLLEAIGYKIFHGYGQLGLYNSIPLVGYWINFTALFNSAGGDYSILFKLCIDRMENYIISSLMKYECNRIYLPINTHHILMGNMQFDLLERLCYDLECHLGVRFVSAEEALTDTLTLENKRKNETY